MSQQLERRPPGGLAVDTADMIAGSSRDPETVTKRLENASAHAHLVSPAVQCPVLPEGTAISFSSVLVDTGDENQKNGEIYPVGDDKYGILKPAFDRISLAAGISWNRTIRNDDGAHPYIVSSTSSGVYTHFDGTETEIPPGTAKIDLSDGAALCEEIYETKIEKALEWAEKDKRKATKGAHGLTAQERQTAIEEATAKARRDIRRKRIKIEELAETGSRLRAIKATFGLKLAYTLEELQKPFVVAKLVATGESDDPELRRDFARMNYERLTGGRRRLYSGGDQAQAIQQPRQLNTGPIVHQYDPEDRLPILDADEEDDSETRRADPEAQTTAQATATATNQNGGGTVSTAAPNQPTLPTNTDSQPRPATEDAPESDFVIKFGKSKGTRISEASMSTLSWLIGVLDESIESEDPEKKKWRAKNEADRVTVRAWIEYRRNQPKPEAAPSQRW